MCPEYSVTYVSGSSYKSSLYVIEAGGLSIPHNPLVVSGGHSLYQASKLLRHSDPSITASRYAVLTSDSLRSATKSVADALNEAIQMSANCASDAIKGAKADSS